MLGEGPGGESKHWAMDSLRFHRCGRDNSCCEHKWAAFNAAFFPPQCSFDPARAPPGEIPVQLGHPNLGTRPQLTLAAPGRTWEVLGTQLGTFREHGPSPRHQRLRTPASVHSEHRPSVRVRWLLPVFKASVSPPPSHHCLVTPWLELPFLPACWCHARFCHEEAPGGDCETASFLLAWPAASVSGLSQRSQSRILNHFSTTDKTLLRKKQPPLGFSNQFCSWQRGDVSPFGERSLHQCPLAS